MSEKKARTKRKTDRKANSASTKTLLAHFKPAALNVEPEPEPAPEPAAKVTSKNYNARVISRVSSFPEASLPLTGKRRRAESDSPPATPARLRSRSPLVLPSSSPPRQRSSSPLILSSSPPRSNGPPSRVTSPPPRPNSPVIIPSSSSPMVQPRSPTIIVDDDSPLSSPPSPPLALEDETTDSDGLGLTTHSFFANVRPKAKARTKPVPNKDKSKPKTNKFMGSQDAPIEIGGEDEGRPKPAVHAFFQPRKAAGRLYNVRGKEKLKGGMDAPWPGLDSIHVGRSTELIGGVPVCPIPRRRVVLPKTSVSDEATRAWAGMHQRSQVEDDILDLSPTQVDAWAGLRHPKDDGEGIPEQHVNNPAIARFNNPARAFGQPSRSEEILGNGTEVGLIKEWLNKLALKRKEDEEQEVREAIEAQQKVDEKEEQGEEAGKKRKKKDKKEKPPVVIQRNTIVRSVAKPKRRTKPNKNEYDPEMIDDDSLNDENEDSNPVQIQYNMLGNTLVVCGGVGSGKSATIHACAQELGWTVFEIYPGIGKRGIGANGLAGWVGDAGMNHMVNSNANKEEISQSVILLDQVDMWFEPDAQYWSAIHNLVNESRRGIIMTTNDMYAFADVLPVHMYYELDQVEPDLASSYLYAQARAALLDQAGGAETEADVLRRLPSRQAFRELYHKTALAPRLPSFAIQDIPVHPHPSQMDRLRDLGRALEEVKFWVIHGRNCQERENRQPLDIREAWDACGYDVVESLGDWSQPKVVKQPGKVESMGALRLGRFADMLSWVDAHLERRWERQVEAAEIDRYAPGPDDQLYYKMVELCKPLK
ncbi:unnamed protein product, partial [Rhizoctonia solani]